MHESHYIAVYAEGIMLWLGAVLKELVKLRLIWQTLI